MGLTGRDALDRSQASAEAEPGSIDRPIQECLGWIGVVAAYNDPWATPVTNCQVRIEVKGSLVTHGPRTKRLSDYGREDGQPHGDVRSLLGSYRQNAVQPGAATIALVPEGDTSLARDIEQQILSKLSDFESSMRGLLRQWIEEWSAQGWWSVKTARDRGRLRGLATWWEGEVDFWKGVGNVASDVWDNLKSGMSTLAEWYASLPPEERLFPALIIGRKIEEAIEEAWN